MRQRIILAAIVTGCAVSTVASAVDVGENTTVGGTFFVDFGNITQQQNGVDVPPSGTGFDVKRAYLIVNHTFDELWSANLTLDANYVNSAAGTGLTNSTTSNSGGVTEFFIKYLYAQAKLNDAFTVRAGAAATPWIPLIDSVTGLRWIEKGVNDRLGYGNSADWGVNALGTFGGGLVNYSASVLDGAGYKNPTRTKNVDFEGRVDVHPLSWVTVAGGYYWGHLGQVTAANDGFRKNAARRWNLLADVKGWGFNVGAEYFNAHNYKAASASTGVLSGPGGVVVATSATTGAATDTAAGASAWVSYDFTKLWEVFARFDDVQLSKDSDRNLRDKFADAGLVFHARKGVDLGLVYKYELVSDGTIGVSSADGNASYTIGGTGVAKTGPVTSGKFNEIGVYSQIRF